MQLPHLLSADLQMHAGGERSSHAGLEWLIFEPEGQSVQSAPWSAGSHAFKVPPAVSAQSLNRPHSRPPGDLILRDAVQKISPVWPLRHSGTTKSHAA